MSDHPELEGQLAAHALGVAEAAEAQAVEAHLPGCADCRELAGRLQRAADLLPLAVEMVEPPARLRAGILAAAAASPRRAGQSPVARVRWEGRLLPRRGLAVPWIGKPWQAAIAVLAIAVLGLGGWNLWLGDQLHRARQAVGQTTLVGQGTMAGSRARIVDLRGQGVALISFERLPTQAEGKVYEVWLIPAGGRPEAVAVFVPDVDGTKTLVVNRDLQRYQVLAVTVEQGPDGASSPSQAPGLAGGTV